MKETKKTAFRAYVVLISIIAGSCLSASCSATELIVNVSGLATPYGNVGCSLFNTETGFPMDNSRAKTEWVVVTGDAVACRFKDVPPGQFALSVGHDINGNRKVDTNFLGIPTEQWGVSNNARPTLRAPRFDEAAFTITSEMPTLSILIKVAK